MMISALAAYVAILCFAVAVTWAGVMDLATLTIRNELVLLLLGTYAALAPLVGFGAVEIGWNATVSLCALVIMFGLFAAGWIGGGDAKLTAVVTLWLGVEQTPLFLLYTSLFGCALTLLILRFRARPIPVTCHNVRWLARLHSRENGVPYGVAIASAALLVFPDTPWMNLRF